MTLILMIFSQFVSAECGKLLKTKGAVRVHRGAIAITAKKNFKILCSDVIVTEKKSKTIWKHQGTRVSLAANSRLVVKNVSDSKEEENILDLTYGKLRGIYDKKSSKSKGLRVNTPTAVAGVRGTDFFITFDPNTRVTKHVTLTGEVLLKMLTTGKSVLVKAGQTVTMNEPPKINFMIASKNGKQKKVPKKKSIVEQTAPQELINSIETELSFDE